MLKLDNENVNTEYKEKYNDSVFKTLCAFANTKGGVVFVGVADNKAAKGFDCSNENVVKVTEQIIHKIGVHPEIEVLKLDGADVLKIAVKQSTLPVSFNGRYYKRVSNTTREMQAEELKAFFLKGSYWDSLTGNYKIDEIDGDTVRRFVRMAINSGRLPANIVDDNIEDVLSSLRLMSDGKITNGAMLLFGKDPQKYFINAVVRVGRFKNETLIIGDRFIDGNLFKQVMEAEEAIKNFINVRYVITGKLQRDSIWDYPLEAIREALLNALIHRDYFRSEVQTQIKIFDNELWYFNIGGLTEGMTMEKLKRVHSSVSRNPSLVHIFYLAGLVEEYGSGVGRIVEAFKQAGLAEPEFDGEGGSFALCYKKPYKPKKLAKPKKPVKSDKKTLNDRQLKAIEYLRKNEKITTNDYQNVNNITRATAKRDLEDMTKKEVVKKLGYGRNAYYQLIGS